MTDLRFTSFLIKVASRCNLDCDYCYVYHHADQSWRSMPKLLSQETMSQLIKQIGEYVESTEISRCAVIFHGGEPLLIGAQKLVNFAKEIRSQISAQVDIGLQTNGLLLDEAALNLFETENISISLSLDGSKKANDKHRLTHKGESSFAQTFDSLCRLQEHPKIFSGAIAVIDPSTDPQELFSFFADHNLPQLDFLLPDSHHQRLPPGREAHPLLYEEWLIKAFDLWITEYPELRVRTFEALLDVITGLPSTTDAFGFGDVSLLSIETDGSYHDLDVLKITHDGATKISGSVFDTSITEVAESIHIAEHRHLLTKEGLCDACKSCSVVEVCGGGALPHRYGKDGYNQPTVYCQEMKSLISHISKYLKGHLSSLEDHSLPETDCAFDIEDFLPANKSGDITTSLYQSSQATELSALKETLLRAQNLDISNCEAVEIFEGLSTQEQAKLALYPGIIAWRCALDIQLNGQVATAMDGSPIKAEIKYFMDTIFMLRSNKEKLIIRCEDTWLQAPFGKLINFENDEICSEGKCLMQDALSIIENWNPCLAEEIGAICMAVQFVRDPSASPDKVVSFSDNSVPGALYVSIIQNESLISPYDLADSIVHEYRHQKLYLLERVHPMVNETSKLVPSPWREELRPPTGLLHAVFVFVELHKFWQHIKKVGPKHLQDRASYQLEDTQRNLRKGFETLNACPLTKNGSSLLRHLHTSFLTDLENVK